jgi:hypothetical protein
MSRMESDFDAYILAQKAGSSYKAFCFQIWKSEVKHITSKFELHRHNTEYLIIVQNSVEHYSTEVKWLVFLNNRVSLTASW